jgi:hypothetical protein
LNGDVWNMMRAHVLILFSKCRHSACWVCWKWPWIEIWICTVYTKLEIDRENTYDLCIFARFWTVIVYL